MQYYKPEVNLKWVTPNGDQMIADLARVSVKDNEGKPVEKLVRYMADHGHFSPFQMANMCVEVKAPRDISRQILRHSSMCGCQELSQRYSEVTEDMFVLREMRLQHKTNRQMSVDPDEQDPKHGDLSDWWEETQRDHIQRSIEAYDDAIAQGIAKEVARVILPEGNTMSRLFLNGSVRTWITYLQVRCNIDTTQREHVWVADEIGKLLQVHYPIVYKAFFDSEQVGI